MLLLLTGPLQGWAANELERMLVPLIHNWQPLDWLPSFG